MYLALARLSGPSFYYAIDQRSKTGVQVIFTSPKRTSNALNNETPKVISVDNLLKSTFAILQIIVIGLQGWMITRVLEHSDRVTKLEIRQESSIERTAEVLGSLREILIKQGKLLEEFGVVKNDIDRMKADLKILQEKHK